MVRGEIVYLGMKCVEELENLEQKDHERPKVRKELVILRRQEGFAITSYTCISPETDCSFTSLARRRLLLK